MSPRIGDVIDSSDCRHCGRPIEQTYWGAGGNSWEHIHSGEYDCHTVTHAEPVAP